MKRKNQRLAIAVLGLLVVNLLFFVSTGTSKSTVDIDRFAVRDTAAVQAIVISNDSFENVLQRSAGGWELNGTYKVDPYLRKVLFAVLSEVGVRRQLSREEVRQLWSARDSRGYWVQLQGVDSDPFYAIGNTQFTRTYFLASDQEGYEVEIPGYRDYIGGIFQLTTDQWRDRSLFKSSFNSLQSLSIDFMVGRDLDIRFKDRFFEVAEVSLLDSGAVVDYLQRFNLLQANEIISPGKFARYDSLLSTKPMATLSVTDIAWNKPFDMKVFPSLLGERIHLVELGDGTMAVFQVAKINSLLVRPSDFEAP